MIRLHVLPLAGLLVSGYCAADAPKQQHNYSVESIQALPLRELWALGEAQRVELGDLVVLAQKYDSEVGFGRHGMRYCGVVMLGSMDLGAQPLGFRLLTKEACSGMHVARDPSAGSRAFSIDLGSAGTVAMQVSATNEVRVDGSRRGILPR